MEAQSDAGSEEDEEVLEEAGPSQDLDEAALGQPGKRRKAVSGKIDSVEDPDEDESAEGGKNAAFPCVSVALRWNL